MLTAITDAGIAPDAIVGASIGAVNGAMFASEPTRSGIERREAAWRDLVADSVLAPRKRDQLRNLIRLARSPVGHAPFERWLDHQLPVRHFDELEIPFECVAASIERATENWFRSGPLVPALLASASTPGVFPPVEIAGEHFYDGGLVNSVPISRAVELGATTIYVLEVGRMEQQLNVPKRWFEAGIAALEISRRHRFATVNDNLPDNVDVHLLPSDQKLAPDDRHQLKWSDFTDSDELIGGAQDATADRRHRWIGQQA